MARLRNCLIASILFVTLMGFVPALAGFGGGSTHDGIQLDADRAWVAGLANSAYGSASAKPPWHQYAAHFNCPNAALGKAGSDNSCVKASNDCPPDSKGNATGPSAVVYSRVVDDNGKPVSGASGQYVRIGITCFLSDVPGVTNVLTMAMVEKAFHETKFALPQLSIQPVGLKTLVNLPTFFELKWPTEGNQPDEVDSVNLLNHPVDIRPVLKSVNYVYGDGESSGPTDSLGGAYPDGSIQHTYKTSGTVQARADAVYKGEFRINGGEWIEIPGEVTVEGSSSALQVMEAKSRLYTN